ncbi:hypothetical protein TorRG33x02_178160 [Trema orientale]|uniref:Uncharacterized protein n=1 Tax=Trema orientale TaxID=63057 RepID=A0A2P5ELE4_TREOI|nr:hypothetical protein TorRG33x02_178160 [Trema orientale]
MYKDRKNSLNMYCRLNRGDEEDIAIPRACCVIPLDMTEKAWNKCVDLFNSEEYRAMSRRNTKSTISRDPDTEEMQPIVENYWQRYMDPTVGTWPSAEHDIRRGYRRGVGPKLNGAASISTTTSSPTHQQPPVPDPELQDFFIQVQNYLAVAYQYEQTPIALPVPPMPPPLALRSRYWPQPPPSPS